MYHPSEHNQAEKNRLCFAGAKQQHKEIAEIVSSFQGHALPRDDVTSWVL